MNPSPQLARHKLRPSSDSPSSLPSKADHSGGPTNSHASGHTTSHTTSHGSGHTTSHGSGHTTGHGSGHTTSHASGHATSHAGGHTSGHSAGHASGHICKDEMPNSTNGIRFRRRSTKTSTNHANQECIIQMEGSPLKYQGTLAKFQSKFLEISVQLGISVINESTSVLSFVKVKQKYLP